MWYSNGLNNDSMREMEEMNMNKNIELQDKLRVLLAVARECLALKDETDILADNLYDDFWSSLDGLKGDLTYMKSDCLI